MIVTNISTNSVNIGDQILVPTQSVTLATINQHVTAGVAAKILSVTPDTSTVIATTLSGKVTNLTAAGRDVMTDLDVTRALIQSGIPFAVPSSGTMGNNGALSGLTAFASTYSAGVYLYLPANAIATGSAAGWYFAVMVSTTAGTVYNNVYTSGQPIIPASPTLFATTGPGAFTGVNTRVAGPTVTVPGGTVGNNGDVVVEAIGVQNNSAGSKNVLPAFGTAVGTGFTATTSAAPSSAQWCIRNRGQQNRQIMHDTATGEPSTTSGTLALTTIDTSLDQSVSVSMSHSIATDWVVVEAYSIQVTPA